MLNEAWKISFQQSPCLFQELNMTPPCTLALTEYFGPINLNQPNI